MAAREALQLKSLVNSDERARVSRLDPRDFGSARDVLAKAFGDYPLVRALFPDGRRRARALSWYVGCALRYCMRYGGVYTAGAGKGVAAFLRAGNRFTYRRLIAAGFLPGPFRMGFAAFWQLMKNDVYAGTMRDRFAPPGFWYLWFVGVDPAAQGAGVGGALMRRFAETLDAEGAPCVLETHRHENLAFYRTHGFEPVWEGDVPSSRLPLWILVRPSRGPGAGAAEMAGDSGGSLLP
jgi:ribosomal protein S18 acetylase RimI-like enzyme